MLELATDRDSAVVRALPPKDAPGYYRDGDKFLGNVTDDLMLPDLEYYFRADKPQRSRRIGDRVFYLVNNALVSLFLWFFFVAALVLWLMPERDPITPEESAWVSIVGLSAIAGAGLATLSIAH